VNGEWNCSVTSKFTTRNSLTGTEEYHENFGHFNRLFIPYSDGMSAALLCLHVCECERLMAHLYMLPVTCSVHECTATAANHK
jgi:hypothetical protein